MYFYKLLVLLLVGVFIVFKCSVLSLDLYVSLYPSVSFVFMILSL